MEERVNFLVRLLFTAWDFGILPNQSTIEEIRQGTWRDAVDQCRLLTSPTYHMLREWHDELERLPYLGRQLAYIRDDPCLEYI